MFVLFQGLYSTASYAFTCDTGVEAETLDDYGYTEVFTGTVIRSTSGCGEGARVRFDVETGIVGVEDGDKITIRSSDRGFSKGGYYLIFARNKRRDTCYPSKRDPDPETVEELVAATQ